MNATLADSPAPLVQIDDGTHTWLCRADALHTALLDLGWPAEQYGSGTTVRWTEPELDASEVEPSSPYSDLCRQVDEEPEPFLVSPDGWIGQTFVYRPDIGPRTWLW